MKTSLRDFESTQERREFLEKELNINLSNIGQIDIEANVENLVGATQIPLGVAGPLLIHLEGVKAHLRGVLRTYIPLATTEGALVASISRGCKAITESGGASVYIEEVGITRGPVFKTGGLAESMKVKSWIEYNFEQIAYVCEKTSHHLKLKKIGCRMVGCNLYARFYYDCRDAMGMNMATIATEQAVNLIEKKTKTECVSLSGNFCTDKKPSWLNFISGRGKRVWAEAILDKKIVKGILKTNPQNLADLVYRKCLLGSIMSGSLGFNGHFANIIAAIFAATGQDLGHVVEGSQGITTTEVLDSGDLYFSIYLPSLIVGTVGGGTQLPTQQEALNIMEAKGVLEYAQIVAAAVLAGELSLLASLTEGSLAKTHQELGRKRRK